ncbi:tetratricopeptide repeat protein [Candidatus Tisiphia endosymbiont of Hybos culiciformis]|uniref:tetratricopeptide repeat protein n=1 Tax=Candidatus Tisiphia endosymbiont of Hybos culiciformis TaxID=3139331 RepID=UPI003CCB368B
MNKYFLLLMMLIMVNDSFAQEQISNMITPVSYFVNHEKHLKILNNRLSKYRQASIVGTSGIGKTQFVRMYAYNNKADYDIIWFFDCNLELNDEFVKLAKQLNSIKNANISEKANLAKKEVISYLTHNNKWLLIFDNLKINENKKIQDFIDWENNGNIIFCSQDRERLPNTVEMILFDKDTTTALANNLLENKDKNDIEFLIKASNGYPILIVQGTQLLNKIKGLDREEYKNKVYHSVDKITTNINMVIKELNPSAVKLLNKIALLNNQNFSKQLLSVITDNKDTLDDDIYQLSKFILISNIDPNQDNPIFEMHDIIANKIMELNGDKDNKVYLEDIILKLPKPKNSVLSIHLWRASKTIRENLEIIFKNSEKYNIGIYAMLNLRADLFSLCINDKNICKAKEMMDWFQQKNEEGNFKLWKMSEHQKYHYARYLGVIGAYNRMSLANFEVAISYLTKSLKILDDLNDCAALKFNFNSQLSQSQASLGNIKITEELLGKMQELFKQGVQTSDVFLIYSLKASLFFIQGRYNEALSYIDKNIEVLTKNGLCTNNRYLTAPYLLRAAILNYLGRYQESYVQIKQLCDMHHLQIEGVTYTSKQVARIYTQLARSELGQGKMDKCLDHINKAIVMYLAKSRDIVDTNYYENPDLAASYVVQGEILFAQDNVKEAIASYKKAYAIYYHLYKDNRQNIAQVSYLYSQGAKAACKAKDIYNYKFFGKPQVKEFGIHHLNTVAMVEYCKQYDMDLWTKKN